MIEKYSYREERPSYRHAAFGIRFLDNMLGGHGERAEVERTRRHEGSFDTRGLPCATTTALIGDSLTQKSQLGRAFLSRAFLPYAEMLAGYLREHSGDDFVMVLLGDHQPPAIVSGEGVPWDVPVHVIASRQDVLDSLLAHGFRKGFTPARPSLGKMHTLTPMLLEAFSRKR